METKWKNPRGIDVDRYRRAERGADRKFRASRDFERAALWLEANGYVEAAGALARAAQTKLSGQFWSERRLQAFTIAMLHDNAPDSAEDEAVSVGAILSNVASFTRAAGLLLMIGQIKDIPRGSAVKIARAVALLASAILDVTDANWRKTRW